MPCQTKLHKLYLLVICFLTLPQGIIAQDTTYIAKDKKRANIQNFDTAEITTKEDSSLWKLVVYDQNWEVTTMAHYSDSGFSIYHGHRCDYYSGNAMQAEMNYLEGKLHGPLKTWYPDGKLKREAVYENGTLVEGIQWSEDGIVEDYIEYEYFATFPGGTTLMNEFLSHHLRYPAKSRRKKIEGRVVVKFYVDQTGKVCCPKIVKSAHELLDEEVIRVINLMPDWNPGKRRDEPATVSYSLPIKFYLKSD